MSVQWQFSQNKIPEEKQNSGPRISFSSFSKNSHQTTAASQSEGKVRSRGRIHPDLQGALVGRTALKRCCAGREELLLFPDQLCGSRGGPLNNRARVHAVVFLT